MSQGLWNPLSPQVSSRVVEGRFVSDPFGLSWSRVLRCGLSCGRLMASQVSPWVEEGPGWLARNVYLTVNVDLVFLNSRQ